MRRLYSHSTLPEGFVGGDAVCVRPAEAGPIFSDRRGCAKGQDQANGEDLFYTAEHRGISSILVENTGIRSRADSHAGCGALL